MDEEERNYCCLVILTTRVGVDKIRKHFIRKWYDVGKKKKNFVAWTDCGQNGTDLLAKFTPLPHEEVKVKSGDTTRWDLSLLVKALLNSKPPFETDQSLVKSLNCLKETRNTVSHRPGKIATADFKKLWNAACSALVVFGATKHDFKKVEQDVNLPLNELTSLMKQCAKQDDEILRGLNTIITHLDKLKQGQHESKTRQEEMKQVQHVMKEGQEEMKQAQHVMKEGQEEIKQVQHVMKEGQEEIKQVQHVMKEGQEEIKQVQHVMKEGQEEMKQVQHVMKEGQQEMKQVQHELKEGQHDLKEGQEEIKQVQHVMKERQEEIINQLSGASSARQVQLSTEDVQLRSKYLKNSTKRQTEFQPKLMASHSIASARTDEIFTNLMMQNGRKSFPKRARRRREHLSEYSTLTGTPIERSQDIFIPQQKGNTHPKSILVTGKPGIGKSLFCQKLVRDWADNVLFEEEPQTTAHGFDFVYLLSFRQLNLIDEEKLTLREVLNRCSLLDEHSNLDEPLFEYMIEHQDKVLFILDGYDEYVHRESITDNKVDQKHESNPRIAMPVAALLSKLLKGNIFREAVVMVTSRSTESNELGGMDFDAFVEIAGFSPQQVKEFIEKYFQSNCQLKNDVLEHVMGNDDLLSFAHVPMFCFLICWCMEWHMKFKTDQDFPVSMTEMYSEVVEIFELKHHSKSQYRTVPIPEQYKFPAVVKETFVKLSKLAAETMKAKKLNFEEEELMQFGLVSEEIEDLKVSGLLTSGPGLRISATKITRYYCFSHLTLHEYFTARWYVENGKVPSLEEIDSEMVLLFFAGLSGKAKCEDIIEELLLRISGDRQPVISRSDDERRILLIRLLYEYDDKDFVVKMINRHLSRLLFFNVSGKVLLNGYGRLSYVLSDNGCKLFSFYIDQLNLFCKTHNELVQINHWLSNTIIVYELTLPLAMNFAGIKRVHKALSNSFCPITSVEYFSLIQEYFDCTCDALPSTNITILEVVFNYVNKLNLMSLHKALLDPNCKVKTLRLFVNINYGTTDDQMMLMKQLENFQEEIEKSKPDIKIEVSFDLLYPYPY